MHRRKEKEYVNSRNKSEKQRKVARMGEKGQTRRYIENKQNGNSNSFSISNYLKYK